MRPKPIELAKHLNVEELAQRYKGATDAKEVRRWHALWLIAQGRSISDTARIVGMHRYTVRDILKRYNERGADATLDRRRLNRGQPPRLNAEQQVSRLSLKSHYFSPNFPYPSRVTTEGVRWNGRALR